MQHLIGGQAGAGILDAQAHPVVAILPGRQPDPPRLTWAVGDGVEGEAQQAAQHHLDLQAVHPQQELGHRRDAQADAAALGAQAVGRGGTLHQLLEGDALELGRAAAEEILQAMHHLAGARRFAQHAADRRVQALAHLAPFEQLLAGAGIGAEGGQGVVELVGEGRRHLAGGGQAQALAQLLAGAAQLIHRRGDEEAHQRDGHREDLQLGHRHRVVAQPADRHDDPDLHEGRADDGAGHALARRRPHHGQEQQVEELEAVLAAQPEGDPQGQAGQQQVAQALGPRHRGAQDAAGPRAGEPPQQRHHDRDADPVAHPETQQADPPAGRRQQPHHPERKEIHHADQEGADGHPPPPGKQDAPVVEQRPGRQPAGQHAAEQEVTPRQHQRRRQGLPARQAAAAHHQLGGDDGDGERQPGDAPQTDDQHQPEGRGGVPRRDVEAVQRVDEAGHIQRHVEADEADKERQAAEPFDGRGPGTIDHPRVNMPALRNGRPSQN